VSPWVYVGIALLILWALLWLAFRVATGLIHLLLIIAVVAVIWGLMRRGARAVRNRM
jgi:hypothetical protein